MKFQWHKRSHKRSGHQPNTPYFKHLCACMPVCVRCACAPSPTLGAPPASPYLQPHCPPFLSLNPTSWLCKPLYFKPRLLRGKYRTPWEPPRPPRPPESDTDRAQVVPGQASSLLFGRPSPAPCSSRRAPAPGALCEPARVSLADLSFGLRPTRSLLKQPVWKNIHPHGNGSGWARSEDPGAGTVTRTEFLASAGPGTGEPA